MKTPLISAMLALGGVAAATAQPTILFEPKGQSVSLGAEVIFIVVAYGPEPISYQWFKDGIAMPGQTDDGFVISSASLADTGNYRVEASSASGTIMSDVATLDIDPSFRVIRSPDFVKSGGSSSGASWVDFNQDGNLDLFICRGGLEPNQLFRNNGDGTFTLVAGPNSDGDLGNLRNVAWADYNNDGFPDVYIAGSRNDLLYKNNGDGTFTRITNGPVVVDGVGTISGAWADYDRDGFLDLVIGNTGQPNALYRSLGDGTFTNITTGPIPGEGFRITTSVAWADCDNDGDFDLVIANGVFGDGNEVLYRNNGDGTFIRVATGPPTQSGGDSSSASWVDYDNDLQLDLFVSNSGGQNNALFHNNGNGTFTEIRAGPIVNDGGDSVGGAWADYDNDGFIDLFVVNNSGQQNFLYHNNGDGTFSRVRTGSLVNELANSSACAWGDYNNDGFLDLFVAKQGGNNSLYQNSGNSNAWIVVKLRGRTSNRSGIGAKVKVLATIGGVPRWQLREIAARSSEGSPSTSYAEFGLGSATVIDTLRLEWPSGIIQELTNVPVRQYITVTETPAISIADTAILEGDVGATSMPFSVTLQDITTQVVSVEYFTSDGSAIAGQDYVATNGVIRFQPGQTNQVISVAIIGDLTDEPNRSFFVTLTNATIFPIAKRRAQGLLIDDDPLLLTITDIVHPEGDLGATLALLPVNLQKPVDYVVSVDYRTSSLTATANLDYRETNGTLVFQPGEMQKFVGVEVLGDTIDEADETIVVNFSNATNVVLVDARGVIIIQDDDPPPGIFINDVAVREGDTGTNHALFTVSLTRPTSRVVSYTFSTSNVTAVANSDYLSRSGTRTIAPGMTNSQFFIVVNGDTLLEGNEVFAINLFNLTNAVPERVTGFGTILDDDFRVAPLEVLDGSVAIRFPTLPGRIYVVEWTDSLVGTPIWAVMASGAGTGSMIQIVDPEPMLGLQRFYRVRLP